jgi:protease-4
MTPAQRNFLQKSIDEVYTLFKERVATGRNMTLEQVESIASGRVWTGIEAKRVGLVDELGGLREAILIAAKLSGIENNYTLSLLPNKDDSMDKMVNMLKKFVKIDANIQRSVLDEYIERVKAVMNMSGKVMALSPVVFNIE